MKKNIGGSEYYGEIHEKIRKLIIENDFSELKDLLTLFKDKGGLDLGAIKTILIVTKAFKEHPQISKIRSELLQLFNEQC